MLSNTSICPSAHLNLPSSTTLSQPKLEKMSKAATQTFPNWNKPRKYFLRPWHFPQTFHVGHSRRLRGASGGMTLVLLRTAQGPTRNHRVSGDCANFLAFPKLFLPNRALFIYVPRGTLERFARLRQNPPPKRTADRVPPTRQELRTTAPPDTARVSLPDCRSPSRG